ncbi:MAG: hypothetical protein NUV45_01570 [Tepidanaerobacteraceae bacterium]|nr:hypothetical protein [Tepidanaerobacteraceae bacterium]
MSGRSKRYSKFLYTVGIKDPSGRFHPCFVMGKPPLLFAGGDGWL